MFTEVALARLTIAVNPRKGGLEGKQLRTASWPVFARRKAAAGGHGDHSGAWLLCQRAPADYDRELGRWLQAGVQEVDASNEQHVAVIS